MNPLFGEVNPLHLIQKKAPSLYDPKLRMMPFQQLGCP